MLEETVVTTEVEKVCAFRSAITNVTVSTVGCVANHTTGTADGNKTDVDEEASVVTAAAPAKLGGAIVCETAVKAELVTAVDVGVIVTLNADCANRLETGSVVLG